MSSTAHLQQAVVLERPDMVAAAADLLQAGERERPTPQHMAALIMRGMVEDDLHTAWNDRGMPPPVMDKTLRQLDALLPFVGNMSEALSRDDRIKIFAARDAEIMFDDFTIRNPSAAAHLLPASMDMWYGSGWSSSELARQFLSVHGFSEEAVQDPDTSFTVVDSGFYGTVGDCLTDKLLRYHGVRLESDPRFAVSLASADIRAIGKTIVPAAAARIELSDFPLATAAITGCIDEEAMRRDLLGTALQILPRYHGSFHDIDPNYEQTLAAPNHQPYVNDCDLLATRDMNISVVNPLAAAVVQLRVVQAALAAK